MTFTSTVVGAADEIRAQHISPPSAGDLTFAPGSGDVVPVAVGSELAGTDGDLMLKGIALGQKSITVYVDDYGVFENGSNGVIQFSYANISSPTGVEGRELYENGTTTNARNFYVKDHLGSTRMVITGPSAATIVEATAYHPYGTMVPLHSSPENEVREKFTGKEYDTEGGENGGTGIGLFYFGARYYDPEIGIFTSTDPLDYFWNAYSYVGGNPINVTDPDGLAPDYDAASANGGDNAYNSAVGQLYELSPSTWQAMMDAPGIMSMSDLNSVIGGLQDWGAFMNYMNLMTKNDSWLRPALGWVLDAYGIAANYDPTGTNFVAHKLMSTIYIEINYAVEQRFYGQGNDVSRWMSHGGNIASTAFGLGVASKITSANSIGNVDRLRGTASSAVDLNLIILNRGASAGAKK